MFSSCSALPHPPGVGPRGPATNPGPPSLGPVLQEPPEAGGSAGRRGGTSPNCATSRPRQLQLLPKTRGRVPERGMGTDGVRDALGAGCKAGWDWGTGDGRHVEDLRGKWKNADSVPLPTNGERKLFVLNSKAWQRRRWWIQCCRGVAQREDEGRKGHSGREWTPSASRTKPGEGPIRPEVEEVWKCISRT